MGTHKRRDTAVLGALCFSLGACAWQGTFDDPRTVLPAAPAVGAHVQVVLTTGDVIEIADAVIRSDSVAGMDVRGAPVAVPLTAVTEIRRQRLTKAAGKWLLVGAGFVAGSFLLAELMGGELVIE